MKKKMSDNQAAHKLFSSLFSRSQIDFDSDESAHVGKMFPTWALYFGEKCLINKFKVFHNINYI